MVYACGIAAYVMAVAAGAWAAPIHFVRAPVPVHVPLLHTIVHNLQIVTAMMAGGMALYIPSLMIGAFNGFLTGALFAALARYPACTVANLAHGIPEVLGQWCALVVGASVCVWVLTALRRGVLPFPRTTIYWASASIALTVVAAAIEALISPFIATRFS
jgi:uncharacterized membrane protein SpoIIM required for sporulation